MRYSHVVDPRTGLGLTSRARAAVVARDGLTADGLATALTLLEEGAGRRLLAARPGALAVVDRADGDGWSHDWPACQGVRSTTDPPKGGDLPIRLGVGARIAWSTV